MTLVDVNAPGDSARRDQWGRYKVVPPKGGKPKGYSRATTVAKALDDMNNLMNWGNRMTALGLAQRPDLLALVKAADPEDRKELDKVCERAKEAGGATARRDLGTALHTMVEKANADPTWTVPTEYAADVAAVKKAIDDAGFDVVDGMSEVMVVLDRHEIAGTADLVLRRRSDGVHFIADLKTGSSVKYGALAWAIQLAIYAHADAIYQQGPATDGSKDQRLPLPAINRETALILHVQPGSGVCDVHSLDIARGVEALECAMAVREWRKAKNLLVPHESKIESGGGDVHTTPAPVTSTEGAGSGTAPSAGEPSVDTPVHVADIVPEVMHQARVAWVLNRIDVVKAHSEDATRMLATGLPEGAPTPKAVREGATWTPEHVDAYDLHVAAVEAHFEIPFGEMDPKVAAELRDQVAVADAKREAAATPIDRPTPAAAVDVEGGPYADDSDVESLREVIKFLLSKPDSAPMGEHVLAWARAGQEYGQPWNMAGPGQHTSARRYAICAAALELLDLVVFDPTDLDVDTLPPSHDPDGVVRLALAMVIGEEALKPALPVGGLLGTLTTDQAVRLGEIVSTHRAELAPNGTPQLVAAA